MYAGILTNSLGTNPEDHTEIGQRVQRLLETVVVAFRPLSLPELVAIVEVEEDVLRLDLEQLSSVLTVSKNRTEPQVAVYHASFVEYLTDNYRCPYDSTFHVQVWEAHGRVGTRCLSLSYDKHYGKQDNASVVNNGFESTIQYASERWKDHLELSSASSTYLSTAIWKVQHMASQRNEDIRLLSDLSCLLAFQSERTSDINVLHDRIRIDRKLISMATSSDPYRNVSLSNLASGLLSLYERSGDMQLLDESIKLREEALDFCPPGHPSRDLSLTNLAVALSSLYDYNGDIQTLNKAIELHEEALDLNPPGHPSRDNSLMNLAHTLLSLYERNQNTDILNKAVRLHREALGLHPPGHPSRHYTLINLARGLSLLYGQNGDVHFLNEFIKLD